jgi:hypothetical protein
MSFGTMPPSPFLTARDDTFGRQIAVVRVIVLTKQLRVNRREVGFSDNRKFAVAIRATVRIGTIGNSRIV